MSMLPDVDAVLGLLSGNMGEYHNQASHSLITAFAASLMIGLVLRIWFKQGFLFWFGWLFTAYTVHLFMDMMTYGRGIMLFWPFTTQRFLLPIPLFYGLRWSHGLWSITHIWTVVSEVAFWAIVFGLARWYRNMRREKAVVNEHPD
jgi:inner membrane protein